MLNELFHCKFLVIFERLARTFGVTFQDLIYYIVELDQFEIVGDSGGAV
jgi:hypothetical protein